MAKRSRNTYSNREDAAMLRYLLAELKKGNENAKHPFGNEIWHFAMADKVTSHSYQSMRDR